MRGLLMRLSLREILGYPILLVGLVGMLLAFGTGIFYRQQIFDNQRQALQGLVEIKVNDLIAHLGTHAVDLGHTLQHEEAFRSAFRGDDLGQLRALINDQFRQYLNTIGALRLEKIQVFDEGFTLREETDKGPGILGVGQGCDRLIAQAVGRDGSARLQTLTGLCLVGGHALHGVLVPIGQLQADGYLVVITDPLFTLEELEPALGMPVRIVEVEGGRSYRSPHWMDGAALEQQLVADHLVRLDDGTPLLQVSVLSDTSALNQLLARANLLVFTIAGLTTLLAILLVKWVFERTTIVPLQRLAEHMRRVNDDRLLLGVPVELQGNREIVALARDFNRMSAELGLLHQELEEQAFTDTLTKLPNRALFYDRLGNLIRLCERQAQHFCLFMIDLDRFKEVNDTLGHAAGDELLQQVASRIGSTLRSSDSFIRLGEGDTVARLGGDEFAALLPLVEREEQAEVVARKMIDALRRPFQIQGRLVEIGMSIGVAFFPTHGESCDQLIHHADLAMYEAKRRKQGFVIAPLGEVGG